MTHQDTYQDAPKNAKLSPIIQSFDKLAVTVAHLEKSILELNCDLEPVRLPQDNPPEPYSEPDCTVVSQLENVVDIINTRCAAMVRQINKLRDELRL